MQLRNFVSHLIVQIYYNLLSYRQEGFTEEYANHKIQTACRVAHASESEQHLRCSPQFVWVLSRWFRAKQRLLEVYLSGVFSKSSSLMILIILFIFPLVLMFACANSQFVYNKNECDDDLEIETVFYWKTAHLRTRNIFLAKNMLTYIELVLPISQ